MKKISVAVMMAMLAFLAGCSVDADGESLKKISSVSNHDSGMGVKGGGMDTGGMNTGTTGGTSTATATDTALSSPKTDGMDTGTTGGTPTAAATDTATSSSKTDGMNTGTTGGTPTACATDTALSSPKTDGMDTGTTGGTPTAAATDTATSSSKTDGMNTGTTGGTPTQGASVLSVPTGLNFNYNPGMIPMRSTFSWSAVPGATGYSVNIKSNATIILSTNVGTATCVNITSLKPGSYYSYSVTASYANGNAESGDTPFSIATYVYTIDVTGANVSGGTGSYPTWALLNTDGTVGNNLCDYVANNLYASMPSMNKLVRISAGSSFVISGADESSAALTRTFYFYNQTHDLITNFSYSAPTSGYMIKTGNSDGIYLKFSFDGARVIASHEGYFNKIAKIVVTGNAVSGSGNADYPAFKLWNDNNTIGTQLHSYLCPNLHQAVSAETWLTIQANNKFVLSGNEGSSACNRTFSFYDGANRLINSLSINNVDTGKIVYSGSSDMYFNIFKFDGTKVTLAQ